MQDVMAIDNGYDFVKGISENGKTKLKFPSITYELPSCNLEDEKNFSKKRMIIEFEGIQYAVGNYAYRQDTRAGSKDFQDEKFNEASEKVKLIAALVLLSNQKQELVINKLAVGLNIENYDHLKNKFVNIYSNTTFQYKLPGDRSFRSITINDVECLPQGVGAFYYLNKKTDLIKSNDWVGLLDIGGRSVDGFIIDSQLKDIIKGTDIGINFGTSKAFKKVSDNIKRENIPYNYIAEKYRQGRNKIKWNNSKFEIYNKCKNGFSNLSGRIATELTNKWDDGLDRMNKLILCGGGALDLEEYLRDELETEIITGKQPQLSNVLGYYHYTKDLVEKG